MSITRVAVIMGTRPEAIKMAPVIHELKKHPDAFHVDIITTAQHRWMLDQALTLFNIVPDYDLDLLCPGQSLSGFTTRVLEPMDNALAKTKPDIILVQGDTTTVFVAALSAFYRKIPVGHIEAGLRSYDMRNPFPEEANRRLTTVLADIHFVPTALSKRNLVHEGVSPKKIVMTGNTVVDALSYAVNSPFSVEGTHLENIDFEHFRTILVTCHRRESLGKDMEEIFHALTELVRTFPDVRIVFPVHLNPAVQDAAKRILGRTERIHLIPPLDYLTFVNLMKRADIILTDSGGLQEEAPTLGKPLLVLRQVTERPEAFQQGLAKVIGTSREAILRETSQLLRNGGFSDSSAKNGNPYGDGQASLRIVEALQRWARGADPLLEPEREFSSPANAEIYTP